MSQTTKKKYKKKDASNENQLSLSTISLNSSQNLSNLSILTKPQQTFQVHDLGSFNITDQPKKTFKFQYNFNQYLRLFLIKHLPLKNKAMMIDPQDKILVGPQNDCEEFLKKIKNQFQKFAMKIIKFNAQADIEQLQFKLLKKYELKIFKKKFMQLTVKDLKQYYKMIQQGDQFLKKIQTQHLILIRVQKQVEVECINELHMLIRGQSTADVQSRITLNKKPSKSSSQEEIIEDEDEPTYYESQKMKQQSRSAQSEYGNKFNKKMEEPTEDDSISVVSQKKRNYKKKKEQVKQQQGRKYQPQPQMKKKINILKQYEFQAELFDRKNFENWLKSTKNISKNINILQNKDPYSEDDVASHVTVQILATQGNVNELQLVQSLEIYLKFRKVVIIKIQNDKYKEQLIQKYTRDDEALTIQFIKGYKSPKWPENQMWKHIIKRDYSDNKKSANTQYFQLFFLQGLKNLVTENQSDIRLQLSRQPQNDQIQEITVKLDQLSDIIKSNQKLKDMIKSYIQSMMKAYGHCCNIINIQFPFSLIKLSLKVKFEQHDQFEKNIKNQIIQKIQKQVKVSEYKVDHSINKFTYDKLQKVVIIMQKKQNSFTYVTTINSMESLIHQINITFSSLNKIGQKQLKVQDDSILIKKVEEHILYLQNQKQQSKQIKVNYHSDSSKFKFYGKQYLLDSIIKKVQNFISQIEQKRISYFQIVKRKQGQLIEQNNLKKKIQDNYQIWIKINKKQLPCKINLTKNQPSFKKKTILIVKSKTLDYAPCGSVFAFKNTNQIDLFKNPFAKTFRNYLNKHKTDIFHENSRKYTLLLKPNKQVADLLKDALQVNPNQANHIIMVMPQNGKQAFTKSIIKVLLEDKKYESKQITIMIIQYGQATDIQNELNISPYIKGKKIKLKDQVITKYFIEDGNKKFYYSDSGNKKILTAKKSGFNQIILNNQDLNVTHVSHQFYTQNLSIVHLQSSKPFPIKINNNVVQFILKDTKYEIPPIQSANIINCVRNGTPKLQLSLGVYQIDLSSMKQINLFSGYERKLNSQESVIKADVNQNQIQAFFNCKIAQIQYHYYFDQQILTNFQKSRKQINDFLSKNIKTNIISYLDFKQIQVQDLEGIKSIIQQDEETQCFYNTIDRTITFKTSDDNTSKRCQQVTKMLLSNLNNRDPNKIQYPSQWSAQTEEIQIFPVSSTTQEFQNVQSKFTCAKIKQLHRIQNKIIFKKYFEESCFLQGVNGKKVKTMQLFHGTRGTNPQEIYKDKEESFNINYSSDNNLLGKGIYFAEKSQYSNDYRYTEVINSGKIFGIGETKINSMFLCEVLVGQSEKCKQHNNSIKDTSFKDLVNKTRFESMTDFLNNSNIFVVYKSRRAYPLYLIKY